MLGNAIERFFLVTLKDERNLKKAIGNK